MTQTLIEKPEALEAVWVLSRDNKGRTTNIITGFPTGFDISNLPDGTKLYTSPQPSHTELITELVEALEIADELLGVEPCEHVSQEAADGHRTIRELLTKAREASK